MIEPTVRDFVRNALLGRACTDCGSDLVPEQPCECCAEKRELLRQVFPQIHGDA